MTKHSEGPWLIVKHYDAPHTYCPYISVGPAHVHFTQGYHIATDAERKARAEADAFLIAAVPDLLAALEYVGSVLDMTNPEHEDFADSGADTVQALCEGESRIRSAIRKAKGGEA